MSSDRINTHRHHEIPGYECLEELALDLIWSWNRRADKVWAQLDGELWALTRNPWVILQTVSIDKLKQALADPAFCKTMKELLETTRAECKTPCWFSRKHPQSPLTCAAYFSMEFMLSEALPIYSGGLGNVAGDQLKAANDLGVPVVAVGLLYSQGYFRQAIDIHGNQQALYPFNAPDQLPITPLRKLDGEWLHIEVDLPGWPVRLRTWHAKIGRIHLYLLDSNDASNIPVHRGITSELYGGDAELRLKQEIVLGIGGWRLLDALGLRPEVCHLNEGHAAFAILERARSYMEEHKTSFETALAATRAGNLFTTHTAVAAGFDCFPLALIDEYLGKYAKQSLRIAPEALFALGQKDAGDSSFNMAYLAIRGSDAVNGVSRLHGEVSRCIFEPLFSRWPSDEIPIGHITNGVHVSSWDSETSDAIWTEACGQERWLGSIETLEKDFRQVPDAKLWQMRNIERKRLVERGRQRLTRILQARGAPPEEIDDVKNFFQIDALTLGFARRFATYKRPNLLLRDPERLIRILTNAERPVQLLLAGKAHPADRGGQAMIREWMEFIHRPGMRRHVAFVPDYDMLTTMQLVKGIDLWINTPRRPWEACGTSGMKVLVNGGLNLSELDGWWAEAYTPDVGWAIGDGKEHGEDPFWDAQDANALYDLLEREIIPAFYTRNREGIPTGWVQRMRESMARLTPRFSANRTVIDYTEKYYIPGAAAYRERTADRSRKAAEFAAWKQQIESNWSKIRFADLRAATKNKSHSFEALLYLDSIPPASLKVQVFANGQNGSPPFVHDLALDPAEKEPKTYLFHGSVPSSRPIEDYTLRAIPHFPGAPVPLGASQILWQK